MTKDNGFKSSGILMLIMLVSVVVGGVIAFSVPLNYDESADTLRNVADLSGQHAPGQVYATRRRER